MQNTREDCFSGDIIYNSNDMLLLCKNEELEFIYKDVSYQLSSSPFEPCFYMSLDGNITLIIHNSFSTSEIISIAKENKKIRLINGKEYDITGICGLLKCAIDNHLFDTDVSYLEKLNYVYDELKKYDECVLDYFVLNNDEKYKGEESHKKAVLKAMETWGKKLKEEYEMDITIDEEKMSQKKIDAKKFFEISQDEKSYSHLFLNPPHGCKYTNDDFIKINELLFPNGINKLDIYEWSTNWSNYFDEGKEWWGTMCVSVYDKSMNRFVVIGASATD